MIKRMPEPPCLLFGPNETPHFSELDCASCPVAGGAGIRGEQQRAVDELKGGDFFLLWDHGRGTDPQHVGGIADPAAIESHVDDLAADLRYAAAILVLQEKDPPRALPVLTLIALGAVGLLARLDNLCALTMGTPYRNGNYRLPPHAGCV
jgi:hypothetical protein